MVFKRNILRDTRTFTPKTSINNSVINNVTNTQSSTTRFNKPTTNYTSDLRLTNIIPSFETPKAYADEVSTPAEPAPEVTKEYDNWYNKRSANAVTADNTDTSKMSVFNENNPDHIKNSGTQGGILGGLFGGFFDIREDSPKYELQQPADAFHDGKSIEDGISHDKLKKENITDPKEIPHSPYQAGGFYDNPDTGERTHATKPEGSTKFIIPDYGQDVQRSSFYSLPGNVSVEKHQKILNTQQFNKFENSLQHDWVTQIRSDGRPSEASFNTLLNKINNANISKDQKLSLLSTYDKKRDKYQQTSGGYGKSDPWSFGNVKSKSPNKAEQLGFKIEDGTVTRKELNEWNLLTGQDLPKGGKVTTKDGSMPKLLTYEDLF